jgi:predicted MFS family arabinose efflux permease
MTSRRFPTAAPDGLIAAVLLSFLATAGLFYVNIMAALVSGLVEGAHFTPREAGFVASANVYGAALGALVSIFFVKRVAWRPAAVVLLAALVAVDLLSILIHQSAPLIGARFLHGTIGGMLVGIGFSVIARTRVPDRVFGMLLAVQFGLGGVGVMTLPRLVPLFGTPVLFLALALFGIVTLLMVPFLDAYPRAAASETATEEGGKIEWWPLGLALVATFLFQAGNMALGAYIIELGRHFGLTIDFMSPILGVAAWIGAAGSLLVVAFGTRYGRFVPLAVALILTVIGNAVFFWSGSALVYAGANIGTSITWAFVVPYLLGICAAFDRSGQTAAMAGFSSKIGLATGPLVGGFLLGADNFPLLIGVSVLVLAASAVAALYPARLLDRTQPRTAQQ